MLRAETLTYSIISLGCSKNQVDSERLNAGMLRAGFSISGSVDDADLIIINTCGFIEDAKRESIEVIMDHSLLKGDKHDDVYEKKIIVLGCLSQRYLADMRAELSEADFIYGLFDEKFIPEMCARFGIEAADTDHGARIPLIKGLPYSYIKISEGCSNNCSYCAIPLIRGPKRSFSLDAILHDAREAASLGAKELIVIAQDTAAYSWKGYGLPAVINSLSQLSGVEWIRLMYCHPASITDELLDTIASSPKVVKYIDMPFQHSDSAILASMNRGGNADEYLALIEKIRKRIQGIRVRSTFMVGYPGETDENFEELLSFVERAQIDRAGAFIYSPEEGTPAALMNNQVPEDVKRERFDRLMSLLNEISTERLQKMIGLEARVLIEEQIDEGLWAGRTEFDAPDVDGIFYLTAERADINSFVRARVTGSSEYDLYGELI